MTEVRSTASGGLGLFATKPFSVGEVILQEDAPLLVFSPPEDAETLLKSPSKKGKRKQETPSTLYESIKPPSSIPLHQYDNFRGMVQAAISYSQQKDHAEERKQQLLELYYPSNENGASPQEEEILDVADKALAYLQKNTVSQHLRTFLNENLENVRKVMLIWACNSFEGGRLYEQHSRINHSCNPNAVVQPSDNDGQCVRAVTNIAQGDEITISYLGLFLYADGPTRRVQLAQHKHFICACFRCTSCPDAAAAIPCPVCHKRSGRYLDEDSQYDDEGSVIYAIPTMASHNSVECAHCHETTTLEPSKPNHPLQLSRTVSQKVVTHLETKRETNSEIQEEWEEQLLQLASSCLGARHWTTNLLLLMHLDRSLKKLSSEMITTGNPPDLTQVAELIDYLQRLVRYVDSLSLSLHFGHLLGNVIIGVARTLVSLGDHKSKKYAAEWLSKIQDDYVAYFESCDMKKVVETLAVAWEKGDDDKDEMMMQEDDDYGESNKRAKLH